MKFSIEDVGKRVWAMRENKATEFIVVGCTTTEVVCSPIPQVPTGVEYVRGYIKPLAPDLVFGSKEELINSL